MSPVRIETCEPEPLPLARDEHYRRVHKATRRKPRILIVDDEPAFTRLVKLALEQDGYYEVQEENHGRHALAAALEFRPDLVLLDVIMPDMGGAEVAAGFRD